MLGQSSSCGHRRAFLACAKISCQDLLSFSAKANLSALPLCLRQGINRDLYIGGLISLGQMPTTHGYKSLQIKFYQEAQIFLGLERDSSYLFLQLHQERAEKVLHCC